METKWSAADIQRGLIVRRPGRAGEAAVFQAVAERGVNRDEFYLVQESARWVLPGGPMNAAQVAEYLTRNKYVHAR